MYESEHSRRTESIDAIPPSVRERFKASRDRVVSRTVLPWGEHCTECNWPTCYTTCELYTPRRDGACRLFTHGMERVDLPGTLNGYLLKIQFKRWAKFWTGGNLRLLSVEDALRKERRNARAGAALGALPLPEPLQSPLLRKFGHLRRQAGERSTPSPQQPDGFLFECFNPNDRSISITFTIRPQGDNGLQAYQCMFSLPAGFTTETVRFADIAARVDTASPFEVELVPNQCDDTVLYFGALDFVTAPAAPPTPGSPATWKCIVWDLDNTLWDGTLVEDGLENLRLREPVVELIRTLDQRGILHSIASKNSPDDGLAALRAFGIEDLFLHPQIGWDPKSGSLNRIAQLLNIGVDTLAFVDDQAFERGEVEAALPAVATVDAADWSTLADRAECHVPVTEDSRRRRHMYRQQAERASAAETYAGDYQGYLKDCAIRLDLAPLDEDNLERVYELAQRTNQMNFSGNRYPRAALRELLQAADHATYVMRCVDRYGDYGIVGFAVVDRREPRLLDLMFSCRVQNKRVEHAFLGYLFRQFVDGEARDLYVNYRPTPKNKPSARVFDDLGFETLGADGETRSLVLRTGHRIDQDDIITLTTEGVD